MKTLKANMKKPYPEPPPSHIKKERAKARKLRASPWWQGRLKEGLCYFCAKAFPPPQLTMEHLIPLARGGLSIKNNLVAACKACNSKKKTETIVESRLKRLNDQ